MKIYVNLEPPYQWVRMDGRKADAFGEVVSVNDYPIADDDEVIAVVPGESVTSHVVAVPAKNRRQFNAAVPFALEEQLTDEVEDIHFSCPNWQAGGDNVVMTVAREKMRDWQSIANESALPAEMLIADYALIPIHDAADYTLVQSGDRVLINQRNGFGSVIDADFLDVWLSTVPNQAKIAVNTETMAAELIQLHPKKSFHYWPIGDRAAHWLEHGADVTADILTDEFRPSVQKVSASQYLAPAMVAVLSLVIALGFHSYRYLSLSLENKRIDKEMQSIALNYFPDMQAISPGKERFMLEQALKRNTGQNQQTGFNPLLAAVSGVLREQNVLVSAMTYRNEQLLITCQVDDFSKVDRVSQRLSQVPQLQVKLESSSADGDVITARYSVKMG